MTDIICNIIIGLSILICVDIIGNLIRDRDAIIYDKNIVGWNKDNRSKFRKNSVELILSFLWIIITIPFLFI